MRNGLFMASLLLLLYTWVGYAALLALLARCRKVRIEKRPFTPPVSIIVAARNEEAHIRERIENLLEMDYPPEKLEILVASDGSTDRTAETVRGFTHQRVRLLEFAGSRGRAAVHNDAAAVTRGEILVFTDAATRFDRGFLKSLLANFADARVGCVSGIIAFRNRGATNLTQQRGLYWRYEYWLRQRESDSGVLACASGPCMAVRKELFRPLADATYDVDFITPLDVVQAGRLVLQEPAALSFDQMFPTPQQELRAQVRMVARNLGGYVDRHCLLDSPQFAWFAWSLVSHKVLRWMTPFFLLVLFASSTALAARGGSALALWLGQVAFYASALLGWRRARAHRPAWVFSAPFAFCLANAGFLFGVWKCLRNERIVAY